MRYILLTAVIMALVLMSGKIDVNIEHRLHLPEINLDQTPIFKNSTYGIFNTKVDVYLKNTIKDMGSYYEVAHVINNLSKGDKVIFHLGGYGGDMLGLIQLQSSIAESKAEIIMLVEAPVFSAHAYLAITPNTKLIMMPNTFLMFHTVSTVNKDCSKETGTDRGVSNVEHCEALKGALMYVVDNIIDNAKLLTTQEKEAINTGHDVYIHSTDPRVVIQ